MNNSDLNRRRFIERTSTGIATMVAASQAPALLSSVRAAEPERKINFALAGLGSLATNQIAPALQKTKYARLAGIITGTPAKAVQWKAQYHIPDQNVYNYDTMEQLRNNPDIDVVYVVTPNGLHREHTLKAARAGKHVLSEKPMANTAKDCEAMIDACKNAGVKLAVGYRCQFVPQHLECIRLARNKVLGEVRIIEAGFGFHIGDPTQWRLRKELAGGGALMDVGIYALQSCRLLTGEEPRLVSALETKTDPVKFAEVDESITWQMTFPSGVIAYCSTSYNVNGINRFTAYADKGWFGMDPAYSYGGLSMRTNQGGQQFEQVDHFAAEMDDFARCILENRTSKVSGEEGLRDLRVIEGIYKSIRTGEHVKPA
jgi:predicted dehydrogenase